MGCSSSAATLDIYRSNPELQEYKKFFEAIELNPQEIIALYRLFRTIDKDKDTEIEIDELLNYLQIDFTPFTRRVFGVIDGDGSGTLNFREFTEAMYEYCTLTKESLVKFSFNLYDDDNSGSIEVEEMIALCKEVYGDSFKKSKLCRKIIHDVKLMVNNEGFGYEGSHLDPLITLQRFSRFCKKHTGLLFPAFRFQIDLREKIQGEKFWRKIERRKANASALRKKRLAKYKIEERKLARRKQKKRNKVDQHLQEVLEIVRQESEGELSTMADIQSFRNSLTATFKLESSKKSVELFQRTGKKAKGKKNMERRTSSFDSDAAEILRRLQKEESEAKQQKRKVKRNRHGVVESGLRRRHSSVSILPGAIS